MKIRKLLVANRGEIARRVMRTAGRMGIATVAVYSDVDANALHVREAGQAVALGGDASADSYLHIDKVIAAARATGADAVHPGYGFLSENADFAQAVVDAGLTWVGPPPQAMRALGSKSAAKRLARARGVPCLPGYEGEDQGSDQGTDEGDQRMAVEAERIGYPLMVKAVAGGGGRGMRLVREPSELMPALRSARSEALAAFGSGELLIERALLAPRHVEVQVFADTQGRCIHLGERDCSVQRRHQKIIEETPSPAVDATLRERMGRCAVELARAAGYVGAGTVEFLVEGDGSAAEFFLMEMNTRLQVEHPVTEMVTGLDLVEWQLRIAQGEPLPLKQDEVRFEGHAIEVRLCAEDETFTPHTGAVLDFLPPPLGEGAGSPESSAFRGAGGGGGTTRFDHALHPNLQVTPHYDSMLGKLIVQAHTRDEAIEHLAAALDRLIILGIPTNRRLLAACLRHPEFRAGRALIPFIAQHGESLRARLAQQEAKLLHSAARRAFAPRSDTLPCPFPRPLRVRHRGAAIDVDASAAQESAGHFIAARTQGDHWHLLCDGIDLFVEDISTHPAKRGGAAAADELRAPFNGKVIALDASPGARVVKGQTLLVIESMKLEHALSAARDGVVASVHITAGEQAATSQVLVRFEAIA